MADVQSPFNPQYERKQEESYVNSSRGADAPNAMKGPTPTQASSAILDAGNLLLTGVAAKDSIYKHRITQEATEQVDAVRDAWTGATAGGATSGDVPFDLRKQLETAKQRTGQYEQKQISDRYYWAQMENIARSVRSRYPGYRQFIDETISSMTGATPANALQRSIAAEANDTDANAKAIATEVRSLKDYIGKSKIMEYTDEVDQSNDPSFLRKYINKNEVTFGQIDRDREALKDQDQADARTVTQANNTANREINLVVAKGMEGPIKELTTRFNSTLQAGVKPTPEQIAEIGIQGALLEKTWLEKVDQVFMKPGYESVSPEFKKAKRQEIIDQARSLTSNIQGGHWDLVKSSAITMEMLIDGKALGIINGSETLATTAAITKAGGPEVASLYVQNKLLDLDKEITNIEVLKNADPRTPAEPLNNSIRRIDENENVVDKPGAARHIIDRAVTGLTSDIVPIDIKIKTAKSLFGPGNSDFLTSNTIKKSDNGNGRIAVFRQMVSPEVAKAMLEVRSKDPGVYNDYINWRNYTFTNLFKSDLNTLAKIPTDDQTMNIQFDQATGKIITQDTGNTGGWNRMASRVLGSESAVNNYNNMIDAMTPTWKLEGLNPGEQAKAILDSMNIPWNAAKGDNMFTMLGKAFNEWSDKANKAIGALKQSGESAAGNVRDRRNRARVGTADNQIPLQVIDPNDPQGILDIVNKLRGVDYTPGDRQSTNVEDRRNEPKTLLDRVEQFIMNTMLSEDPDGDERMFIKGNK